MICCIVGKLDLDKQSSSLQHIFVLKVIVAQGVEERAEKKKKKTVLIFDVTPIIQGKYINNVWTDFL